MFGRTVIMHPFKVARLPVIFLCQFQPLLMWATISKFDLQFPESVLSLNPDHIIILLDQLI